MSARSARNKLDDSDFSPSKFASSSAKFASASFARATSPTRVSLYGRSNYQSSSSFRFSVNDRKASPGHSVALRSQISQNKNAVSSGGHQRKTCTCSPTEHPGSFRCSLHRRHQSQGYHSSNALNFRRSAMVNSLVRIGGVEGDLVKRSLSTLIRPSSHQQRRRATFEPKPSRLSIMSIAKDS
ncbi:hypothetical protein SLE2022_381290 [Rubroshorea leprosula]